MSSGEPGRLYPTFNYTRSGFTLQSSNLYLNTTESFIKETTTVFEAGVQKQITM